jgi:hypothetical protein
MRNLICWHSKEVFVKLFRVLNIVFILAPILFASPHARADALFDMYFVEGTLRIDIAHSGTRILDEIAIRRITKEPLWAGPRQYLIPPFDMGKYRLDLIDKGSGQVIYRYGFSTLFGEWITTEEASVMRRAFEETLEVPFPRDSVEVSIFRRNENAEMEPIFTAAIDPNSHLIGTSPRRRDATVINLLYHGAPPRKVDLLILGDGYTAGEWEKFEADCRHFMDTFFEARPFDGLRDRFNVRAVFAASRESGIDEPRKNIYRDTPLGMTFDMFDSPRYCMTEAVWAVHDLASLAPHDVLLIMPNTSRYGGGAIYNYYTVFVSDNEYDDYLPVHEFGHGFAGLGDEYYTSAVAYSEFYPPGVEPWEPNITALLDPGTLKWKAFVEPNTPIPTPEGDSRYWDRVGAFEGAGYAAKGLFRPAIDCKMFSKGNRNFCKVCEYAMITAIKYYAPDRY